MNHSFRSLAFAAGLMLAAVPAFAQAQPPCGNQNMWIKPDGTWPSGSPPSCELSLEQNGITIGDMPGGQIPDTITALGLTWKGESSKVQPLLQPPLAGGQYVIQIISGQKEPAVGLITAPGALGCLVRLNEVCVIAGRKLTVE